MVAFMRLIHSSVSWQPTSFIFWKNSELSRGEQCFLAKFRRFCCNDDQSQSARAANKKNTQIIFVVFASASFVIVGTFRGSSMNEWSRSGDVYNYSVDWVCTHEKNKKAIAWEASKWLHLLNYSKESRGMHLKAVQKLSVNCITWERRCKNVKLFRSSVTRVVYEKSKNEWTSFR